LNHAGELKKEQRMCRELWLSDAWLPIQKRLKSSREDTPDTFWKSKGPGESRRPKLHSKIPPVHPADRKTEPKFCRAVVPAIKSFPDEAGPAGRASKQSKKCVGPPDGHHFGVRKGAAGRAGWKSGPKRGSTGWQTT
jgi:hypothetical protein